MRIFVDTNLIVYSRDRRDAEKQARARHWLRYLAERQWAVLNLQVVNETADVLLRRSKDMTASEVRRQCEHLLAIGDTAIDIDEIALAWEIRARFGFRWWDGLIVAAAILLDCSHLVSEDLQHGQSIGRLRVLDPFRCAPEELPHVS
jgi:predicted nucleic acid-binding protein